MNLLGRILGFRDEKGGKFATVVPDRERLTLRVYDGSRVIKTKRIDTYRDGAKWFLVKDPAEIEAALTFYGPVRVDAVTVSMPTPLNLVRTGEVALKVTPVAVKFGEKVTIALPRLLMVFE